MEWADEAIRSSKDEAMQKWMSGAWTQAQFEAYAHMHQKVFPGSTMNWKKPLDEDGLVLFEDLMAALDAVSR